MYPTRFIKVLWPAIIELEGREYNPKDPSMFGLTEMKLRAIRNMNLWDFPIDPYKLIEHQAMFLCWVFYVLRYGVHFMPAPLDVAFLCCCYHRETEAVKALQRTVGVNEDSILGRETLGWVLSRPAHAENNSPLHKKFLSEMSAYYVEKYGKEHQFRGRMEKIRGMCHG